MSRPLRIGLISEGRAELGTSVPDILDPSDGGKIINPDQEGALHTLIRRELGEVGLNDVAFIHRHRTVKDNRILRTGHSVIQPKYLSRVVVSWKPEEVDMVVLVIDVDDELLSRQDKVAHAQTVVTQNLLDQDGVPRLNRCATGLAIKNFDTWLLADTDTVASLLGVVLAADLPHDLESLPGDRSPRNAKAILDSAIGSSAFQPQKPRVQNRHLEARWQLADIIHLDVIRDRCQAGYLAFINQLVHVARNSQPLA